MLVNSSPAKYLSTIQGEIPVIVAAKPERKQYRHRLDTKNKRTNGILSINLVILRPKCKPENRVIAYNLHMNEKQSCETVLR